ncbi:sigma-54-dependent Fis family transcriptional regulator [Rhodoferax sp.]|uniref:sigma-54 interaction domain-containing protein n=3 Tax=Rhodoferax sp. TaxID=50421 RepID=UPI00260AB009|nr:sigma-54-dependent Fis family transcriptional regulator [Rhodoferax sp.]MDD4942659.1 sigma-54-dependent Fis family transcriptional regulator [Rhodoferax sp.]MDD5478213.1 sigma-54-dependent Fis family transcriptional regulator [Rhodoferax sp.]
MKPFPELMSFIESLPEPHILFDTQYRILAANAAYRRQFSPDRSVVGRTCFDVSHRFSVPCDQAGESCPLVRSRESGQRERVLHLHHTSKGEEYVSIELAPLQDASGLQTCYVEKMEPLKVAQSQPTAQGLIGRSASFMTMLGLVARVAPSQATVLLLGESGTGKELVARAVHEASTRASKALVPVDCSSLPENLFESELFGHERGAFTGANTARGGLVEAASGGTLFLDEVGDIPLSMQVKLLRLLETGTYRRVGSTEQRHADIRVVSATHRDLDQMVAQGKFREDLYYRLSTFPIHLPALRERQDDISLLCAALLERVSPQRKLNLSDSALQLLQTQTYPGNVRELRNLLERSALLCDGSQLQDSHVQQALQSGRKTSFELPAALAPGLGTEAKPGALAKMAQAGLREMVRSHTGSRAELAAQLGISERSLYRKLKSIEDSI